MQNNTLGILALNSARQMGERVNRILGEWNDGKNFLLPVECPRFGSGEGKAILPESVREKDIFIMVDICNSSVTYKMDSYINHMSPDDHYQDVKRVIAACNGEAARINVVMPFLYEGRQHRKTMRESLDCAMMLRELENMNVHTIITFDAHDPRIQNVTPLHGLLNIRPALQFTQCLLTEYEDIQIDGDHLMFISPDEGAMERVIFLATLFEVNVGMFYKRRDYTRIVDGVNPIISHDFCGGSVEGKDVIVVDDMISSGGSMLDVAAKLKDLHAKRVFLFSTFGLFTHGLEKFDKAYEKGLFDRVFTTNLIYQKPELLERPYYMSVGMGRFIAAIIQALHRGNSVQEFSFPETGIRNMVNLYKSSRH